jgi:hypothetical protein
MQPKKVVPQTPMKPVNKTKPEAIKAAVNMTKEVKKVEAKKEEAKMVEAKKEVKTEAKMEMKPEA